jgi:hypothetical protein
MMPILLTTETACASLATSASVSASLGLNVYTGIDNEDKEAPAVICSAISATEDFPQSGIWHVKTFIKVKEIAEDTTNKGNASTAIFQRFLTGSINTDLKNNASNFYVFDVFAEDSQNTQEGDAWVQTLSLDIVAALTT